MHSAHGELTPDLLRTMNIPVFVPASKQEAEDMIVEAVFTSQKKDLL